MALPQGGNLHTVMALTQSLRRAITATRSLGLLCITQLSRPTNSKTSVQAARNLSSWLTVPGALPILPTAPGTASLYPTNLIEAPVKQVTFWGQSPRAKVEMSYEDFARDNPMFLEVRGHPLIKDHERAVKLNPAWQPVIGSVLSIAHVNLRKGVLVASSFRKENLKVYTRFCHAYLVEAKGVRFHSEPYIHGRLAYAAVADLLEDTAKTFQPHVRKPADFCHLLQLMRCPIITKAHAEMLVFNPCLMSPMGYVGFLYHMDHLLRRLFPNSENLLEIAACTYVLPHLSRIVGQYGESLDDSVVNDPFLFHIYSNRFPISPAMHAVVLRTGKIKDSMPQGAFARGALVLGIARHQLVHGWDPHIRSDPSVRTSPYDMAQVVDHQRWRLPELATTAAQAMSVTRKYDKSQLSSFFENHPLSLLASL